MAGSRRAVRSARRRPPRPGEGSFQLSMIGGAMERSFDALRPEIARLPWGTLATARIDGRLREQAQETWLRLTYAEHCAAAAISAAVAAMVQCCAPVDLVAVASRFVFDELSHAELSARIVAELGGAPILGYDARNLYAPPDARASPLAQACELIMRVFCGNECLALPLVREEVRRGSGHPLIDGLVRRILKDEGPHGAFGWVFLDWAAPHFDARDRKHLRRVGAEVIADVEALIEDLEDVDAPTLGWLPPGVFKRAARRAIDGEIVAPLRARGLLAT